MKAKLFIIILILLVGFSGCNSDFLEKMPLDNPSNETFFSNEQEMELALTSAYRTLYFVNGEPYNLHAVLDAATDCVWIRWNMSGIQEICHGTQSTQNSLANYKWSHHYRGIAKVNNILDNLDNLDEPLPQDRLDEIVAQAKFIRAYSYYELTQFFGDVPLIKNILTPEEAKASRTSKSEVVNFILTELDEAASKLPIKWENADEGRITRGAALALKARVALYNERYDVAEEAAKDVIDLKIYSLYPNYTNLFLYEGERCSEVILDVAFHNQVQAYWLPQNQLTRNAGGWSQIIPTQNLIDSYECTDGLTIDQSPLYDKARPFENRDPRLDQTIVRPGAVFWGYVFETHPDSTVTTNVYTGQRVKNQDVTNAYATYTGYCFRKYMDEADDQFKRESTLNFILIRYAEVLLIYAEAKIEQNKLDQSVYDALNTIRSRPSVMMPVIETGKSQAELRSILRRERKIELAYEGQRYHDINRWKIAEHVMPGPVRGRPRRDWNAVETPTIDQYGNPQYSSEISFYRNPANRVFNTSRDYLLPIPQTEMDINENLVQNPGY